VVRLKLKKRFTSIMQARVTSFIPLLAFMTALTAPVLSGAVAPECCCALLDLNFRLMLR
jgi:hypothetical protein